MTDFWFNSEESVAAASASATKPSSSRPPTGGVPDESARERLQKLKALLFDMFAIEARPPVDLVLDYLDLVHSYFSHYFNIF